MNTAPNDSTAAARLTQALEAPAPFFDGTQERLFRRLDPDEFRHDIASHANFVGRESPPDLAWLRRA